MITIDTGVVQFNTDSPEQARAFVDGFKACLENYGIYRDGVRHIGCLETPIVEIRDKLEAQLAAQTPSGT